MKRYEQAKKDYEYLVSHHGADANDLTGGFVIDEKAFDLLRKPTKRNAAFIYECLISQYANSGYEPPNSDNTGLMPDFEDEEVCEIFRRNGDEESVMAAWGVDIYEEGY